MTMTDTVDQRITLAREYLDEAQGRSTGAEPPRLILERELAETRRHLGQVFDVIDQGAALTPSQLGIVLFALDDAAAFREQRAAEWCGDCETVPDGACDSHVDGLAAAGTYRQLARQLEAEAR
jgi:hypothetical protein